MNGIAFDRAAAITLHNALALAHTKGSFLDQPVSDQMAILGLLSSLKLELEKFDGPEGPSVEAP